MTPPTKKIIQPSRKPRLGFIPAGHTKHAPCLCGYVAYKLPLAIWQCLCGSNPVGLDRKMMNMEDSLILFEEVDTRNLTLNLAETPIIVPPEVSPSTIPTAENPPKNEITVQA
jgi:hypothetical protein